MTEKRMKEETVQSKFGHVKISDNVIAAIAGLSATDVKGVASLAGGIKHEMITHSDGNQLANCIRVNIENGKIGVRIAVVLDGTIGIPEVAEAIRKKVKGYVETMTGNEVSSLDIVVSGVNA